MTPRKRAFTLIELLVVIAIIAILAAILFPVFAQAREKARQSSCASNYKQTSMGILQYVQDYDETMPLGIVKNGGTWAGRNAATVITTPADLRGAAPTAVRLALWANAVQPYMKNYQIYDCPSAARWTIVAGATNYPPPFIHETFNGFLTQQPLAGINSPADLILVWSGHLKTAYNGYADSNPQLDCPDGTQNCIYQPAGSTCAAGNGGTGGIIVYGGNPNNYTEWTHGSGDNRALADGHVKWYPLMRDPNKDPFASTNTTNGSILNSNNQYSTWWNGCHSWLFRPDYQP